MKHRKRKKLINDEGFRWAARSPELQIPFSRICNSGVASVSICNAKKGGGNILQDFGYDYDIFANLAARKDNLRNLEERFTYDRLNRLTDIWLNNAPTGHMAYDALGRMTDKQADGQQVFASAQHDYIGPDGQLRPHAISGAQVQGNPFPTEQLDIDYTMFDKAKSLRQYDENGILLGQIEYQYGFDQQRRRIVEKYGNAVFRKKIYSDQCEFVTENSHNSSCTFLSGPLGVFAVVEKSNGEESMHYVLKDHLGSWTTITDDAGIVLQELSFDAWGNLRDPETWSGSFSGTLMFDRGFTGHEHLEMFGLINMNGRMYDPVMSTFLSVDNYVQAPDFSQSFNRYAYCLNNPLKYVDPDGWQMMGGNKPRNPFHENWSVSHVAPAHGPSAFVNPYNLLNMALYGNLYGPSEVVGGGHGGGGGGSMDALYGTYGYYATHQANSVYNYSFPGAQLQLVRNWQDSPSISTNRDLRGAGITDLTVGVVGYGNGKRSSFYQWSLSGNAHTAAVLNEYVGGTEYGSYSMTVQPLDWYGVANPSINNPTAINGYLCSGATIIGEAAKMANEVTASTSVMLKTMGKVGKIFGGLSIAINGSVNAIQYQRNEITLYSMCARDVMTLAETGISCLPYGIGVIPSIALTAFDIEGGFDQTLYSETWTKEFFRPRYDYYQIPNYYRHGK